MAPYNWQFQGPHQVPFLKVWSILIGIGYFLLLMAIIDTMRLHKICRERPQKVKLNLYKFYFLAILMCLGRMVSQTSLYLALKLDNRDVSHYFNYGFYTACLCIILIAVSQVNTINTSTLRSRYLNKMVQG